MSTDLPGYGRDPRDDIVSGEPGLDALLGMLTADATPDELTGENAALAMFRANHQPARPFQPLASVAPPATVRRDSRRRARRIGLMAAAVTLSAAAGFAVAAYTQALPTPLQQAAYHVLGFAGVPSAHHPARSATAPGAPVSVRRHGSSPRPRHSTPAAPRPTSSGPASVAGQATLSITAASGRIVAGRSDTFTAQLTGKTGGVAGASVSLLEREAGQTAWQRAGTATTGSNGSAAMSVSDITVNAAFRLRGPDGTMSRPVLVIVMPPVSATVAGPSGVTSTVTATSLLAAPGDTVVLQAQSGKHWTSVQLGRLNGGRQVQFTVRSRLRQRRYRVVLLPTASHGLSVSNTVTVAPR